MNANQSDTTWITNGSLTFEDEASLLDWLESHANGTNSYNETELEWLKDNLDNINVFLSNMSLSLADNQEIMNWIKNVMNETTNSNQNSN